MSNLCNNDISCPLKFEIWDHQSNGKHQYMGSFKTNVKDMVNSQGLPMTIIEEAKLQTKGYVDSGSFMATNIVIEKHPTLQEYILGGCEVNLQVAIDFTGSNGSPNSTSSLHYIDPTGRSMNQYQSAIHSVGNIVAEYDTDKKFPVYGFGCSVRLPNGKWSEVKHSFPIAGEGVEVQGSMIIIHCHNESHIKISCHRVS